MAWDAGTCPSWGATTGGWWVRPVQRFKLDSAERSGTWPWPALAEGRLGVLDVDHFSFSQNTPWPEGTSHLMSLVLRSTACKALYSACIGGAVQGVLNLQEA